MADGQFFQLSCGGLLTRQHMTGLKTRQQTVHRLTCNTQASPLCCSLSEHHGVSRYTSKRNWIHSSLFCTHFHETQECLQNFTFASRIPNLSQIRQYLWTPNYAFRTKFNLLCPVSQHRIALHCTKILQTEFVSNSDEITEQMRAQFHVRRRLKQSLPCRGEKQSSWLPNGIKQTRSTPNFARIGTEMWKVQAWL